MTEEDGNKLRASLRREIEDAWLAQAAVILADRHCLPGLGPAVDYFRFRDNAAIQQAIGDIIVLMGAVPEELSDD